MIHVWSLHQLVLAITASFTLKAVLGSLMSLTHMMILTKQRKKRLTGHLVPMLSSCQLIRNLLIFIKVSSRVTQMVYRIFPLVSIALIGLRQTYPRQIMHFVIRSCLITIGATTTAVDLGTSDKKNPRPKIT